MPAIEGDNPSEIGRYQVIRELGKGAMGRVLLCEDPVLQRKVAIKHLRTDLAIGPEQRAPLLSRIRQEARASARVSHANLVALHDMGEDPVVALYLVFEYVHGPTLKEQLREGRLGVAATARLARELANGMHFAHLAGVLHRDIKPENVMLSPSGAKLADFGIARIPDSTLTQGGSILGTPAYSAPEAIGDGNFSPQSDQFSLAATLYEALSGRRAFPGEDAVSVATLIANSSPGPIASECGTAAAVDGVFARALAKLPGKRFANCEQFGQELSKALESTTRVQQLTLPDSYHENQTAKKGRAPLALGAALVGAAFMWAGEHWAEGREETARSSIVTAIEIDESTPVAWLAERPPRTPQKAKAERTQSPKASSSASHDNQPSPAGSSTTGTP